MRDVLVVALVVMLTAFRADAGEVLLARAGDHGLLFSDIWIHMAQPGVEFSVTVTAARAEDLPGAGNGSAEDWGRQVPAGWQVTVDGKICPLDRQGPSLVKKAKSLRVDFRFLCALPGEEVLVTPRFRPEEAANYSATLFIGGRITMIEMGPRPKALSVPLSALMESWGVRLAPKFINRAD